MASERTERTAIPATANPAAAMPAVEAAERDHIMHTLASIVEPLARIVPGECEVVLHDLGKLPDSIVAISGSLTGRNVGGPATDMLMQWVARGRLATRIGYEGQGVDGRELDCSTIVVRTSHGTPVAALCINSDTRQWRIVAALAQSMLPESHTSPDAQVEGSEHFAGDVDELAEDLLSHAIDSVDVPVHLMHKRHKMSVVAELRSSGFFILRESVERAAQALGVTRFTIYNYLKELDREESGSTPPAAG